jgi:hypothetical protein
VIALLAGGRETAGGTAAPSHSPSPVRATTPYGPPARLAVTRLGRLAAPVQDAAVTVQGRRVYAFGGLDTSGSSTDAISVIAGSSIRRADRLPQPLHDAGAAAQGGGLYIVGWGQAAREPGIARFSPGTGVTSLVGSLPTALSDLTVVSVGRPPYVIGGYTGAACIYALSHGRARPAGRLPVGLRYAAASRWVVRS